MLRFITITGNGRSGRVRARMRTKTARHDGQVVREDNLPKSACIVIEGAAQAGKTRALERIAARADDYWGSARRRKERGAVTVLQLSGREALTDWLTRAHESGADAADGQNWNRLTTAARITAVVEWVAREDVRLLLDDAHLLAGGTRREAVAVQLLRVSAVWWATCSQLERVPQSLRMVMQSRGPRVVSLGSTASHDHTAMLIWVLLALCAAAGAFEVAGLLGLLMMSRRGRGALQESR